MQHTALVGKTIWLEAGRLQRSLEDARKRAIRLEARDYSACTPRTGPNARNWLGELLQVHPITRALSGTPPRTGQVAGEIVALGVLATLEARIDSREGKKIISITRGECSVYYASRVSVFF